MPPIELSLALGLGPQTPTASGRGEAVGFAGLLEDPAGSRPRGRLGLGRMLGDQPSPESAGEDQDLSIPSIPPSGFLVPTALVEPAKTTRIDAQVLPADPDGILAKSAGPHVLPGAPDGAASGKTDGAQVLPAVPDGTDAGPKIERPLVLPGGLETAAKPHGPLILPAEAGRPSPTTLSLLAAVTGQARADGAAETIRRVVAEAPQVTPPQPVEGEEASAPDVQLSSLPTAPSGSEPSPATPARAGAPTPDTGAARSETAASPRGAAETGEVAETAPDAPLEDGIDVLPVSTREAIAPQPARPDAAAVQRQSFDAVTQVAAQIIRRLEGRSTRFEMELHPADMGRVDVRLDIDAEGRVAARLAFDNPAAAADLRGRADELRRNLEDAGFQLADDALDFADREGRGRRDAGDRDPFARSAREAELADAEAQPVLRSLNRLGLDVRI